MEGVLAHRFAGDDDISLLARMNKELIEDEGHPNPMNVAELALRMADWLQGDYQAVLLLLGGEVVAYALYRPEAEGIYLRHFYVGRPYRRRGVGRKAIQTLLEDIWPRDARITVEVLSGNASGRAFWQEMGFQVYSLALEMPPRA